MSDTSNGIYAASTDTEVFVRVVGRGSYLNSQPLREYGLQRLETHKNFYIDLSQCLCMDSTFLGVLAGFALKLRNNGCLHLVRMSERNLDSIKNLGLDRLADVAQAEAFPAGMQEAAQFEKLGGSDLAAPSKSTNKLEVSSVMLEAHEDLCRAHEPNETKFKDVKRFLREEIAAQKPTSKERG